MKIKSNDEGDPENLEKLAGGTDKSEIGDDMVSDAASDSPGDDAILEQEEIYEGISSDSLPSEKTKN